MLDIVRIYMRQLYMIKFLNMNVMPLVTTQSLIKSQMRWVGYVIRMDDDNSKDSSMFIILYYQELG